MTGATRGTGAPPSGDRTMPLVLIGAFKLFKAALMIAVGIGAHRLLHTDLADTIHRWARELRADPENRLVHALLERSLAMTPAELERLSIGTFGYAALFLAEGIGLLLRKPWAEYLTVVTTAALFPIELVELGRRVTPLRIAVLAANVAVVWYLVVRVRARRARSRRER